MEVILLGTGSADRWPNPWCACPRCATPTTAGPRGRTSVLVDRRILIDPGPDAASGAALAGVDFQAVSHVLIGHGHPDHLDPAFLLAWAWAGRDDRLVVAGPAHAIDLCRPWVGPHAPVDFVELRPGDGLEVPAAGPGCPAVGVRALTARHSITGSAEPDGTAVLLELSTKPVPGTGEATRLLYATDTAGLAHDELAERFDLVLLELTLGDRLDHASAHLDLPAFGREVAALRGGGRLAEGARVVAVHLSHHNPEDLPERLAAVGAEALADGSVIQLPANPGSRVHGRPSAPVRGSAHPRHSAHIALPAAPRSTLVLGGARSGKSRHAESLAAGESRVTYVATGATYPDDPEWQRRVDAHRARRPEHWTVLETADLAGALADSQPGELVLVDCLTLWLTRLVDAAEAWADPELAQRAVARQTDSLLATLAGSPARVVLVSNEVGAGVVPATASGRLFQDLLGTLNAQMASACDEVHLVVAGLAVDLRGRSSWGVGGHPRPVRLGSHGPQQPGAARPSPTTAPGAARAEVTQDSE